jgi:hypothetical protein
MGEQMGLFIVAGGKVKLRSTKMLQKLFGYPLVAVEANLQAMRQSSGS